MEEYKPPYYQSLKEGAINSARVVVPIIINMIKPKSVIDVGCGIGAWLYVFQENGISDLLGY